MNIENVCILIQGRTNYTDKIIEHYSSISDRCVISTNSYKEADISKLKNSGFKVLLNHTSKIVDRKNFNNQVINTFAGVKYIKDHGFDYVFKIRSDMFFSDIDTVLESINPLYIYFPSLFNGPTPYLTDYMLFGSTDFMCKLWDIPEEYSNNSPELRLQNRFDDIRNGEVVDYIFKIIEDNDLELRWMGRDISFNRRLLQARDNLHTYKKY